MTLHWKLRGQHSNKAHSHRKPHQNVLINKISFSLSCTAVFFVLLCIFPLECSSNKEKANGRKYKPECKKIPSSWSECSKPCDMGVSSRTKVKKCKLKQEVRLCMVRTCGEAVFHSKSKGKRRCVRHKRAKNKMHLKYLDAKSEKKYRMKFCGECSDVTKCCTPLKTKTKKVWFKQRDGTRFSKKMSFIRKCRCHSNCRIPPNRYMIDLRDDMMRDLRNDMMREDKRSFGRKQTQKKKAKQPRN